MEEKERERGGDVNEITLGSGLCDLHGDENKAIKYQKHCQEGREQVQRKKERGEEQHA